MSTVQSIRMITENPYEPILTEEADLHLISNHALAQNGQMHGSLEILEDINQKKKMDSYISQAGIGCS